MTGKLADKRAVITGVSRRRGAASCLRGAEIAADGRQTLGAYTGFLKGGPA